jgi:CRISPR type III-A-associated protein Csm2
MQDKYSYGKSSYGNRSRNNSLGNSLSAQMQSVRDDMNKQKVEEYYDELKKGYFTPNGVIKKDFIVLYPEIIADNLTGFRKSDNAKDGSNNMSYTQIRSFYECVRVAESAYRYSKDAGNDSEENKEKLLIKIKRLDGVATYALGRDKPTVTKEFRRFIKANVEACNTVEDVVNGFMPHFEALVAYFKYKNPKSK